MCCKKSTNSGIISLLSLLWHEFITLPFTSCPHLVSSIFYITKIGISNYILWVWAVYSESWRKQTVLALLK